MDRTVQMEVSSVPLMPNDSPLIRIVRRKAALINKTTILYVHDTFWFSLTVPNFAMQGAYETHKDEIFFLFFDLDTSL